MKKILVHFFAIQIAFAQNPKGGDCDFSINGKVFEAEKNIEFEAVAVFLKELNLHVNTDEKGNFIFRNLCKGDYTIEVSYLGYKNLSINYRLQKSIDDKIFLHSDTCSLPSVTIKGEKENEIASLCYISLTTKEINQNNGQNLGEMLRILPGVDVLNTGTNISKPMIHGMSGNRIASYSMGVRQEGQQWGAEHAPEIDPFLAGKISVIKGAASVRYGSDAMAGVILVDGAEARSNFGVGAKLNSAFFTNNRMNASALQLEGRHKILKNLAWRVNGTFRKGGNYQTPSYYVGNTGLEENNFAAQLFYEYKKLKLELLYSQFNTTIGVMKGSHFGNIDDLRQIISEGGTRSQSDFSYEIARPYQKVFHEMLRLKASWTTDLGSLTFISATQYNDRAELDAHKPINQEWRNKPQLQYKLFTFTNDLVFEHKKINKFHGSIGIATIYQLNNWDGRLLIPFYQNYNGGIFAIEKYHLGKLEFETGLRYDFKYFEAQFNNNQIFEKKPYIFQNLSAIVGVNYYLNEHFVLKNNFGRAWRAPNANELFSNGLHHGTASLEYGNPNLKAESGYKFISSLEYKTEKVKFEINAFAHRIENYIYLKPANSTRQLINGAFPEFNYTQTHAFFYGTDGNVMLKPIKNWEFNARYTFVNAYDIKSNGYLVYIPPYNANIEVLRNLNFWESKNISNAYISMRWLWVNEQTRVEANSDYMPPPAAYQLLNAQIGSDFKWNKHQLNISFQARNILNTTYRSYMNRLRYFADEPGRDFILRVNYSI